MGCQEFELFSRPTCNSMLCYTIHTTLTMSSKEKKRKRDSERADAPHKRVSIGPPTTVKITHLGKGKDEIGPVVGMFTVLPFDWA